MMVLSDLTARSHAAVLSSGRGSLVLIGLLNYYGSFPVIGALT